MLVAHVVPIAKLPRKTSFFDYEVPTNLSVKIGQVVVVSFRNQMLKGLIINLSENNTPSRPLKPILSVTNLQFSQGMIAVVQRLGQEIVQSPGNILQAFFGDLNVENHVQTGLKPVSPCISTMPAHVTMQKEYMNDLKRVIQHWEQHTFTYVDGMDAKHAAILGATMLRKTQQPVLVLFPHQKDAHDAARAFTSLNPLIFTGRLTQKERAQVRTTFTNSSARLVFGTDLLALLEHPTHPCHIILARSSHPDHLHTLKNPRFDVRRLLTLRHHFTKEPVLFCDVVPAPSDTALFPNHSSFRPLPLPNWISQLQEHTVSSSPLPASLLTLIEETLEQNKRVLLVTNKKGTARRLSCTTGKHVLSCATCTLPLRVDFEQLHCIKCQTAQPIPVACPACACKTFKEQGMGNRKIQHLLEQTYTQISVGLCDTSSTESIPDTPILIVTDNYLQSYASFFETHPFRLIAILDADTDLYRAQFHALSQTLTRLAQWGAYASLGSARYVVQTQQPELLEQAYGQGWKVGSDEWQTRADYGFEDPRLSYRCHAHSPNVPIETLKSQLAQSLPKSRLSIESHDDHKDLTISLASHEFEHALPLLTTFPDSVIIEAYGTPHHST